MLRRASASTNKPLSFHCLSKFGAHIRSQQHLISLRTASTASGQTISPGSDDLTKELRVQRLIDSYRACGHYKASIDPLGVPIPYRPGASTIDVEAHGLSSADFDRKFRLEEGTLRQFRTNGTGPLTLRDIVEACEHSYCRTYSVEYEHIDDSEKKEWLRNRLERPEPFSFTRDDKAQILDGLIWGGGFERLLATKFPTEKRYGLDGVEGLAPAVASLIDRSAEKHGVNHVVVGSCHRGRLALSGIVYGKPLEGLFAEFMGRPGWGLLPGSCGDVKTHLGFEGEHRTPSGNKVGISVIANPSHLESVSPVSQGSAHATQRLAGPDGLDKTLCLALHGDAAFTGQGVVYETLSLAHLPAYDVGGTVRLLVNNQIGFTADPGSSRSTAYCTDLAKFLQAPIFHVNSDSTEELVFVCQLAADWRAKFKSDVVVDIVCYRKFGHNEMDQPRFTQPLMYQKIANDPSAEEIYHQKLLTEGSFTKEELISRKSAIWNKLNQSFESAKTYTPEVQDPPKAWNGLPRLEQLSVETIPPKSTGINAEKIHQIIEKITSAPEGFNLHNNLKRILDSRKKAADQGSIDWTAAEALALGSVSLEGHHVRFLGEDAQRGTFSQRHATFHDQKTGETFTPLANLSREQGPFLIDNSPLSEYGALGFEYGVTTADPFSLVIWEAQFGDFVNTAQVMIDNIISGAETKWGDRSGLVLSLPHGLDGQGPEHSSARIERFLMLSSESGTVWPKDLKRQHQDCNMQIIYPTTPANYFHALRRQLRRDFRKPLVVFFSKSLLRHALTRSPKSDFVGDSAFKPVIADPDNRPTTGGPNTISRVILCTGQVYAALQQYRETNDIRDAVIVRIEELNPFPFAQLKAVLDRYPDAGTIVWTQEEHYNGGAWHHVRDRVSTVLNETEHHTRRRVVYAGRAVSATTAAAKKKVHLQEEEALLRDAFSVMGWGDRGSEALKR